MLLEKEFGGDTCDYCGKQKQDVSKPFIRCSTCCVAYFCCRECQSADWNDDSCGHKMTFSKVTGWDIMHSCLMMKSVILFIPFSGSETEPSDLIPQILRTHPFIEDEDDVSEAADIEGKIRTRSRMLSTRGLTLSCIRQVAHVQDNETLLQFDFDFTLPFDMIGHPEKWFDCDEFHGSARLYHLLHCTDILKCSKNSVPWIILSCLCRMGENCDEPTVFRVIALARHAEWVVGVPDETLLKLVSDEQVVRLKGKGQRKEVLAAECLSLVFEIPKHDLERPYPYREGEEPPFKTIQELIQVIKASMEDVMNEGYDYEYVY